MEDYGGFGDKSKQTMESFADLSIIKKKTLAYIESMHIQKKPYGQYCYSGSTKKPVLYSSTYAVMTRHLYRNLDSVSGNERKEWISYIQSFQTEDGLFKDPVVADSELVNYDWWGWRHLTCHVIVALTVWGSVAQKEFACIKPFHNPDFVKKWLLGRDWSTPASSNNAGNEILNYGTLLQYSRDFHNDKKAKKTIEVILDWLLENQNSLYGAWGPYIDINNKIDLAQVMMGGYHEFLLFFYDKRPFKYQEIIIDRILFLQNEKGGFIGPHHAMSSACQDIDAIDPLSRLTLQTEYRKDDIKLALEEAISCVLSHQNKDGGFVFYRDKDFEYGHEEMYSRINESDTFSTWFRTLSLSIIGQVLSDEILGKFNWQFTKCPGYQFW